MENPQSIISQLVPSSRTGGQLYDLQERFQTWPDSALKLKLSGYLDPGLYLGEIETQDRTFSGASLHISLVEWPTLKKVKAGPFDFDHTRYRMVVPCFRVFLNGEDLGLVWCEVPSPEDYRRGKIRATWGFTVKESGQQILTLQIPPAEKRLRWSQLASLTIRKDHRQPSSVTVWCQKRRPRLFLSPGKLRELKGSQNAVQREILGRLQRKLQAGSDSTYQHRTVTAGLVGFLTGQESHIKEAIKRTRQLCRRAYWGYHNVPEIMGWNNDRDTGMRLFETAFVYDWLYHYLSLAERKLIRERLTYVARLAHKITHLQYGYWYTRMPEAHGQGFWFGFGCAALALLGEEQEAKDWLNWFSGNVQEALRSAPEDGITEWLTFNAQWLILSTMLLEKASGTLTDDFPFLANFRRNIIRALGQPSGCGGKLALLLFYLASRFRDRTCQADALACLKETPEADLDPLTLLACDCRLAPCRATAVPVAFRSQNGLVVCRDKKRRVEFIFRCGSPLSARQHQHHTWNGQLWYSVWHSGSFSWTVDGKNLVPLHLPGYSKKTREANLITIAGAGHLLDGRWLGGRISLQQVSRLEHYVSTPEITFCHSNNAPSYKEACGVRKLIRRWVFFHRTGTLIMEDEVATTSPRRLAWHLHTAGQLLQQDENFFLIQDGESRLSLKFFSPVKVRVSLRPARYVPSYSCGLNAYRTRTWQPEVHRQHRRPPDFWELNLKPLAPVSDWSLVTVIGVEEKEVKNSFFDRNKNTCRTENGFFRWSQERLIKFQLAGRFFHGEALVGYGRAERPEYILLCGVKEKDRLAADFFWSALEPEKV
ncbi:MAG TPA: hypothetical protein PKW42_05940, partial [bacterium]|nr:hypothetical protein [bacterium]